MTKNSWLTLDPCINIIILSIYTIIIKCIIIIIWSASYIFLFLINMCHINVFVVTASNKQSQWIKFINKCKLKAISICLQFIIIHTYIINLFQHTSIIMLFFGQQQTNKRVCGKYVLNVVSTWYESSYKHNDVNSF